MPVNVEWEDSKKSILRYRFDGLWTWEECLSMLVRGRIMMKETATWVCILNDFSGSKHIPAGFIPKVRDIISTRPDNTGLVIFLTPNLIYKDIFEVLKRLFPEMMPSYLVMTDEAEALDALKKWLKSSPPRDDAS